MTFPNLYKDFEWFDRLFDIQTTNKQHNFPRASIYMDADNNIIFNFALAGYTKSDVQITFDEDKLTINGRKENKPLEAKKVFQNQIAYRDFEVLYRVPSEYVNPSKEPEASFDNGILIVKLAPRANKEVKQITIK